MIRCNAAITYSYLTRLPAVDLLKNAGQFTAEVDGALAIDSLEAKKWFVVSPDSYDFK